VAPVAQESLPVELQAIGTVQPYATVTVKTQIGGQLQSVHFKEGESVRTNDLLAVIDPRPYQAALKELRAKLEKDLSLVAQAKANLEKDTIQAKNAENAAGREKLLRAKGMVSQEEYDKSQTDADALQAAVRADNAAVETADAAIRVDKAQIETAQIQLDYCTIRSPIDGVAGSLLVQQGNIVKAQETILVVINRIVPSYVAFSIPEKYLPDVKKYQALGKLPVAAVVAGETETFREAGALAFVDNAVDTNTGTIRLKAVFDNKGKQLWPGQFANVTLTLTNQADALVIPSQAIMTGQAGAYVYVVKPDMTVEARPVVLGRSLDNHTAVRAGLKVNENVVTDGQMRLRPGARVEVKTAASPASAEGGLS